jgi:hypothetical protein
VKAVPAPAEDTAGAKLAIATKGAANAKHEVLKPWAGGRDGLAIVD